MSTETMDYPRETLARRGDVAGELPMERIDLTLDPATYVGMSIEPFTEAQATILTRPLAVEDVDIRPDGQVYMGHAKLRQRLNEAFRPGGWALRRLSSIDVAVATEGQADRKTELVMSAEFGLYVGGRFVSSARGEQKYQDNGEMTYGDAAEGMKSNALSRCCKDLGIALDLWDRNYADRWRTAHAVQVWGQSFSGKNWPKPKWRALTALPFLGETGPTKESPNQDRYVHQTAGEDRNERRQEARAESRQASPAREREPGDDDEPTGRPSQPAPAPRPAGSAARVISDAQSKRLFAIARGAGMDSGAYAEFLRKWDYNDDRSIRSNDYDQMVEEARAGGR
jgi:hypothetical protein